MFESEKEVELTNSVETHELRVAIFDLSRRALAGYFGGPSLIKDLQTLNEHGLPGITHEKRATTIGTRQALNLPPMKLLGRLASIDGIDAYVVSSQKPIPFRNFTVQRYELDDVHEILENPDKHPSQYNIDEIDAQFLASAFRLPEIRNSIL